jgi:hypothetical protein
MHFKTGVETWNATFSRIVNVATGDSPGGGAKPGAGSRFPRLMVSADNTLQAFDAESGFEQWSIAFDVPPVAAYSSELAGAAGGRYGGGTGGGARPAVRGLARGMGNIIYPHTNVDHPRSLGPRFLH